MLLIRNAIFSVLVAASACGDDGDGSSPAPPDARQRILFCFEGFGATCGDWDGVILVPVNSDTFPLLEMNVWVQPARTGLEANVLVARELDGATILETTVPLFVEKPQGNALDFSVGRVTYPICGYGTTNGSSIRIRVDAVEPGGSIYASRDEVRRISCDSGDHCMTMCWPTTVDGGMDAP